MSWTRVAAVNDLADGQMKEISLPDRKILLSRVNGDYYATSATCTHYGAALIKGVLHGERLVCPWHGGCFNVVTGDIEEAPAMKKLEHYPVRVDPSGEVFVDVSNEIRFRPTKCPALETETYAIVGGGAAGLQAAETLREEGFMGRIVVICEEPFLPYDRPKLSKAYNPNGESIALRKAAFLKEKRIEVMLNTRVGAVLFDQPVIQFTDGEAMQYNKVLLATGCSVRTLDSINIAGGNAPNVHSVRTAEDTSRLAQDMVAGAHVVILGSSFIGVEMAAVARSRDCVVTVIGRADAPLQHVLGREVGCFLQEFHESKGVQFAMRNNIASLTTDPRSGRVTHAVLTDGRTLRADCVIVAVGVVPRTELLAVHPKVQLMRDGSVNVDKQLRVKGLEDLDVYACGDMVSMDGLGRIEHWAVAQQHGRVAATNMCGNFAQYNSVPFFWHAAFGKSVRCVGYAGPVDEVIVHKNRADWSFEAYFVRSGHVIAVATLGRDPIPAYAMELMRAGSMPSPDEVRIGNVDWAALLSAADQKATTRHPHGHHHHAHLH
jgi:NADPH-dependent 2,4-dienoyl-CoA reductase/sulfur reductase-like enzyme/nitrite reductase/ring-hydroxylating ferredoxin subunit